MFGMIAMHFNDKIKKKKNLEPSGKKSLPCKEKTENQSVCTVVGLFILLSSIVK